jgi:hypothetical protein
MKLNISRLYFKFFLFICIIFFILSWAPNQDLKPEDFLNKGGRVTVFALKPETPLVSAVEQLANYLENLNV